MSADIEELLCEGMERFTRNVRVPAGLACAAARRHRRRRMTVVAVAACAAIAVSGGGFAAAGLAAGRAGTAASGGTGAAPTARTAVYLMRRAEQAAASQQPLIDYARSVDLAAPATGYEISWTQYDARSCTGRYRREDIVGGKVQMQYATRWEHSGLTYTAVNYPARAWTRSTSHPSAAVRCSERPAGFADYRGLLEWGLRHKYLVRIAGTVTVDGVQAIKIVSAAPRAGMRAGSWDIWVSPRTYLPVRTLLDTRHTFPAVYRVDLRTDYLWLPPTRANLAELTARIPAGFKREAPTQVPLSDACGFIPCN